MNKEKHEHDFQLSYTMKHGKEFTVVRYCKRCGKFKKEVTNEGNIDLGAERSVRSMGGDTVRQSTK